MTRPFVATYVWPGGLTDKAPLMPNLSPPSGLLPAQRRGAAVIAAVAGITLVARVAFRLAQGETLWQALSFLTQLFTILTNTLVLLAMALIACGVRLPPRSVLALVVAIAGVGLIYHALLARLVDLDGLDLLADHGVHTVVPLLSVLWWILWAEKVSPRRADPALWVVWPLIYCAYALLRAQASGFYPYPFIDLPTIGPSRLALNMVLLIAGFTLIGATLAALSRFPMARQPDPRA